MTVAPAISEKPLVIMMEGAMAQADSARSGGRLHIGELPVSPHGSDQGYVAVLASSLSSPPITVHEDLAVEGMLSAIDQNSGQHLAELMKQGFREANRAIRSAMSDGDTANIDGVAMLALLTRGKYATLGLVGPDRAYLMRANRLTQLTRDQRVVRARSRRKQDIEEQLSQSTSGSPVQLLGEQDRLESRSPAIFETTLLPEDRLALLSRGVVELVSEDRILTALGAGWSEGAGMLTATSTSDNAEPLLAVVLQVAPSRDEPAFVPATAPPSRLWWPILLLILTLIVVAVGIYFIAI